MKSKLFRGVLAALGIMALMLALVTVNPSDTSAANLTGGQYTYLIDGEEVTFTFDPVVRKDGLLLPTEVFAKFGITIEGATGKTVTLKKADVTARVTIGSLAYELDGRSKALVTGALRLNGRVFLPSDLLKEFGIDFSQDGNYISLRTFTDKLFRIETLTDVEWSNLKSNRGFTGMVKADSGVNIYTEFTLLNQAMITASNFNITYGTRARLLGMLETNTLVLVKLSNLSNKAGAMVTAGAYLVDNFRNQYDVQSVLDIGYGLITSKVAPSADRTGILVYPKLPSNIDNALLYYDNNGYSIGTFRMF